MSDKQKELKRLHDIVFEGAPDFEPDCISWSAMGKNKKWHMFRGKPKYDIDRGIWRNDSMLRWVTEWECKSQPETFLDWTETLIKRGDYESPNT